MQLTHLDVDNFKGLLKISVPLSRFVCLIGENNAGKSSFLQALLLFVEGRKLEPSVYFDPGNPIVIAVRMEEVSEADLSLISSEEHRTRFREILRDGSITLVRRYEPTGSSRLRWMARVPAEERFSADFIDGILKGKKPGPSFAREIGEVYPEVRDRVGPQMNQTQARALIEQFALEIPDDRKCDREMDLPSGIDNSIRPLLPEPIYIPAVKDLADEIATKDSASFGRLMGILLNQISPELEQADETFRFLKTNLNRIRQPDGSVIDGRLPAVRNIETIVQTYMRENFPKVDLDIQIPPPEIKAILSGAQIWVNDGVLGLIESKGDGLKRTVTFSILRAYVELKRTQKSVGTEPAAAVNYLFLFEEPELYLHPSAQGILFDALGEISKANHVLVSTHSPLFFGHETTGTFIKLVKTADLGVAPKPFARALCIDLTSLDNKSRFQIISYETNNTAFFFETVVLVEGDSELLAMPHMARTLNPDWTPERSGVAFCRVGGKRNIARYREFFEAFEVRVCVIGDLDCILEGFDQLGPSDDCKTTRDALLNAVDAFTTANDVEGRVGTKDLRDIQSSPARRELFEKLIQTVDKYAEGKATKDDVNRARDEFFTEKVISQRRQVLEDCNDSEIVKLKRKLFELLRGLDVFLLERGTTESYYPNAVTGPDKPTKAMDFCARIQTKADLLALCDVIRGAEGDDANREFCVILSSIYGPE